MREGEGGEEVSERGGGSREKGRGWMDGWMDGRMDGRSGEGTLTQVVCSQGHLAVACSTLSCVSL